MKAFVLQMCSQPDVESNIEFIQTELAQKSSELQNAMVILPECFAMFGGKESANRDIAEELGQGTVQNALSCLAKQHQIFLVAGSFPIIEGDDARVKPVCIVFGPNGEVLTHYQKIHLFDVDVADGVGRYRESDAWQPGNELVLFDWLGVKVGVAICYDVRFPAMFTKLRDMGAKVIVLPSAFTQKTGDAHWSILLRARAIENQVYFVGCNQAGKHSNGRETYGHSQIIGPWGNVMLSTEYELGLFGVDIDFDELKQIRSSMPVQQHSRMKVELD
jgi:predicted amidohydrolase